MLDSSVVAGMHVLTCAFMTGLIWFVQVVHYPLFRYVDRVRFPAFAANHQRLTTYVVGPVMILEVVTAIWIVLQAGGTFSRSEGLLNLSLLLLIWLATFFLSVPCHEKLKHGFDDQVVNRLVSTNLLRTLLWSVRLLWLAACFFG